MKLCIISPDYPSEKQHSFSFVHARAKLYNSKNIEVKVFVVADKYLNDNFESINVIRVPKSKFLSEINIFEPDVIAIHFPTYKNIHLIDKLNYPKVVWLHGHEILWLLSVGKSKNIFDYVKKRVVLLPRELYQLYRIRSFLDRVELNIFVSNWMLKSAEKTIKKKIATSLVIPNPVDTELFNYREPRNIFQGVSLRGLANNKYGIDIAIKAFSNIKKHTLTIVGQGRLYKNFNNLISKINSSSTIQNRSIRHNSLPEFYSNFGFFVAPSRIEAQGVAMCEAMSCGLPVIATNVGGIPEFVRDGIDGYLVPKNNPSEMRKAIIKLTEDPEKFKQMSLNARENILKVCSEKTILQKELDALNNAIHIYSNKMKNKERNG